MGRIFFVADLEQSTLIAIKNAYDCADIANDLGTNSIYDSARNR